MTVSTEPPTALVTGAAGVLGRQLVRYLVERQWSVRALVRQPASLRDTGVTEVTGNLLDADVVRRAAEGADVVFHLAARRAGSGSGLRDLARDNVDGTSVVAHAARLAGVRRVVYFGSTAVYGDTRGETADERSVPQPQSEYARTKLEAESIVLQEAPGGVVLRIAAVYGPHKGGNYLRLAALCGRGIRLMGRQRRTLVYEQDAMNAALMAAEHEAAQGRIFNVTDGMTYTLTEMTGAMASALGVGVRVTVPTDPVRAMARLASIMPHSLRPLLEDSAVEGRRIQVDLGFRPAIPLHRGWQMTITGWREQGLM